MATATSPMPRRLRAGINDSASCRLCFSADTHTTSGWGATAASVVVCRVPAVSSQCRRSPAMLFVFTRRAAPEGKTTVSPFPGTATPPQLSRRFQFALEAWPPLQMRVAAWLDAPARQDRTINTRHKTRKWYAPRSCFRRAARETSLQRLEKQLRGRLRWRGRGAKRDRAGPAVEGMELGDFMVRIGMSGLCFFRGLVPGRFCLLNRLSHVIKNSRAQVNEPSVRPQM